MKTETVHVMVYEIENGGDLAAAADDIRAAGGRISGDPVTYYGPDPRAMFKVEVADRAAWVEAFRATDSFDFSNQS